TLGSHWHEVRIEFEPTWSSHATYGTYPILLQKLQLWGGYPAGKRTIYSVDSERKVTFPSYIYATNVYDNGQRVYSPNNKPSPADIGASATGHQHVKADITDLGSPLYSESDPVFTAWNKSTGISITKSQVSDFPASMPASDVSAWAKAASKPAYTYSEVGAAASGHNHSGVYEPVFTKNTAFNKNFGTAAGTVCQGNDSRLSNLREPVSHLADDDTYGLGDSDMYGHCKILNILTRSTYYDGEALSAYQGYALKTLVDGKAASDHGHGYINNSGQIRTVSAAVGAGDRLVITDYSKTDVITRGPEFGTSSTKSLRENGTWVENAPCVSIKNFTTYVASDGSSPVAIPLTITPSAGQIIGIEVICGGSGTYYGKQILWMRLGSAGTSYPAALLGAYYNSFSSNDARIHSFDIYWNNSANLYIDDAYTVYLGETPEIMVTVAMNIYVYNVYLLA
ncbi:MAG: hypothetical protein GX633_00670, partial [Clostridiales bacterium]|nr:hypothetical protein [Clostridiales bacterium]